jgi:phage terminase large subunit-like protein
MTSEERTEAIRIALELERRQRAKFNQYFPDEGPFRRALYPKHLAFFKAGATYVERLFLAANRVGKTDAAAYEVTAHLTGQYPAWWEGRRFEAPTSAWLAGKSAVTTRDIIQHALLGDPTTHEAGMMPQHLVVNTSAKAGIADAIDTVWIQHVERHHGAPAVSIAQFKSYDQGRKAFEGTGRDVIWLDEEPDEAIENECLVRTMTSQGIVPITFTPLQGLTTFVQEFLDTAVMYAADGSLVDAHAGFWGQADAR